MNLDVLKHETALGMLQSLQESLPTHKASKWDRYLATKYPDSDEISNRFLSMLKHWSNNPSKDINLSYLLAGMGKMTEKHQQLTSAQLIETWFELSYRRMYGVEKAAVTEGSKVNPGFHFTKWNDEILRYLERQTSLSPSQTDELRQLYGHFKKAFTLDHKNPNYLPNRRKFLKRFERILDSDVLNSDE